MVTLYGLTDKRSILFNRSKLIQWKAEMSNCKYFTAAAFFGGECVCVCLCVCVCVGGGGGGVCGSGEDCVYGWSFWRFWRPLIINLGSVMMYCISLSWFSICSGYQTRLLLLMRKRRRRESQTRKRCSSFVTGVRIIGVLEMLRTHFLSLGKLTSVFGKPASKW